MWRFFLLILISTASMLSCSKKSSTPEDPLDRFIGRVSHGPDTLITDMTKPLIISFRLDMVKESVEEALSSNPQFAYSPHWTTFPVCNSADPTCYPDYYQLYLYPDLPFMPDTTYQFLIETSAYDITGDSLPSAFNFQFTTDSARLTEIAVQYDGVDDLESFPQRIKLWFNTGIDISGLDFPLRIDPPLEYELQNISSSRHAFEYKILTPLRAGSQYSVSVEDGVFDIRGNPVITGEELQFATGEMAIIYYYPNPDINLKDRRPTVQVRFNTVMDKISVQNSFNFSDAVRDYPGTFFWLTDKAMQYILEADLMPGDYTFSVSVDATDFYGVHLKDPFSHTFKIK